MALATVAVLGVACVPDLDRRDGLDEYRARIEAVARREVYQSSRIVDRHGRLLSEVSPVEHRVWVDLRDVAPAMRSAVVATEDRSFYENPGVDPGAVGRAAMQNLAVGRQVSGASTIPMQLVRLVAFGPDERTELSLDRKLKEATLAAELSRTYSKSDILEMYLNMAYFGHGAYGIQAAARTYFGLDADSLSLAQAALLAGLLQAPSATNPYLNMDGARARQRAVLDAMLEAELISPQQADLARADDVELRQAVAARRAPHFIDYVVSQLPKLVGDSARLGGLTITTTLDIDLQEAAATTATRHVERLREQANMHNVAVVAVKPSSGEIMVMLGGIEYGEAPASQINMALRPRQMGSTIKPFIYAALLQAPLAETWTPASILWDVPLRLPSGAGSPYEPNNYDGRFHGPVRLRDGLANSYNVPAVKALRAVGVERALRLLRDVGLPDLREPDYYGLSLALGSAEASLLDVTAAYGTLANAGRRVQPVGIIGITNAGGRRLYQRRTAPGPRAIDERVAWLLSDILSDRQARRPMFGRGPPLETSSSTAVKTGTTDGWRDNWTVGYWTGMTVGVWSGNASGAPMVGVNGLGGAAPIWHEVMESVLQHPEHAPGSKPDEPPGAGPPPAGITQISVCDLATLAWDGSCTLRPEYHLASRRPPLETDVYQVMAPDFDGVRACGWTVAVTPGKGSEKGRAYLRLPTEPDERLAAQQWLSTRGIPLAPPACEGAELSAQHTLDGARSDPGGAVADGRQSTTAAPPAGTVLAGLTWPHDREHISGHDVPIVGTVAFEPRQMLRYRVDLGVGWDPAGWESITAPLDQPVRDARLAVLDASNLVPGAYTLRLVLVLPDGGSFPAAQTRVLVSP